MDPETVHRGVKLGAEALRAQVNGDPATLMKVIDAASSEERRWALWYLTLALVQATVRRMSGDDAAARRWLLEFVDANAEDATLTALAASLGEDRA